MTVSEKDIFWYWNYIFQVCDEPVTYMIDTPGNLCS